MAHAPKYMGTVPQGADFCSVLYGSLMLNVKMFIQIFPAMYKCKYTRISDCSGTMNRSKPFLFSLGNSSGNTHLSGVPKRKRTRILLESPQEGEKED